MRLRLPAEQRGEPCGAFAPDDRGTLVRVKLTLRLAVLVGGYHALDVAVDTGIHLRRDAQLRARLQRTQGEPPRRVHHVGSAGLPLHGVGQVQRTGDPREVGVMPSGPSALTWWRACSAPASDATGWRGWRASFSGWRWVGPWPGPAGPPRWERGTDGRVTGASGTTVFGLTTRSTSMTSPGATSTSSCLMKPRRSVSSRS